MKRFFGRIFIGCGLAALLLLPAGCKRGVQADLQLEKPFFNYEGPKAMFYVSVKNTGTRTYKSVYLVADLFQDEQKVTRVISGANLPGQSTLAPGQSASISGEFEDGGLKPNRTEIVRLYGNE